MKNELEPKSNGNSTLYSILDHLSEKSIKTEQVNLWPGVRKQFIKRTPPANHKMFSFNKSIVLPAFILSLLLIGLSGLFFNKIDSVSAQQILNRAVEIQASTDPSLWIHHTRRETITYPNITEGDSRQEKYIVDSYYDVQNGRIRWVFSNAETGTINDAFSFDGTYTFSADQKWLANPSGNLLPIIRSIESQDSLIKVIRDGANATTQQLYEMNRNSANYELVGNKTWQDGHEVYVLRSKSGAFSKTGATDSRIIILIFDTQTYQLLEQQELIEKDGHEYLSMTTKYLTDELLPIDSQIPWDFSDLQGVKFIDGYGVIH